MPCMCSEGRGLLGGDEELRKHFVLRQGLVEPPENLIQPAAVAPRVDDCEFPEADPFRGGVVGDLFGQKLEPKGYAGLLQLRHRLKKISQRRPPRRILPIQEPELIWREGCDGFLAGRVELCLVEGCGQQLPRSSDERIPHW